MKAIKILQNAAALAVSLVFPAVALATALPEGFQFDDWSHGFVPNPITTSGTLTSQESWTQSGISINRIETVTALSGGTATAETKASGPDCQNPEHEGCVIFKTTGQGMLTLDYKLGSPYELGSVMAYFRNLGIVPYDVDMFYLSGTNWLLAEQYNIAAGANGYYRFDFPQSTIGDQIMIMYNPLTETGQVDGYAFTASNSEFAFQNPAQGAEVELCCVMAVPEPGSLPLVGLALGLVGFVGRRTLKLQHKKRLGS